MTPKEVLDVVSANFKNETRRFYVGSTHDVEQRRRQHEGVFGSAELVVVHTTADRSECVAVETTLINALVINNKTSENKEKRSKLPNRAPCLYSVYLLFDGKNEHIVPSDSSRNIIGHHDEPAWMARFYNEKSEDLARNSKILGLRRPAYYQEAPYGRSIGSCRHV